MRTLILLITIFILSSCASSKPQTDPTPATSENTALAENTALPEEEELVCVKEKITGTHIVTTTCLTRAEKEEGRKNSRLYIDRLKRTPEFISSEPGG